MLVKVISSCSIKAFRYRVHALEQDLWKASDPLSRANLALQLADAATTLARLEMQEAQKVQQVVSQASAIHEPKSEIRVRQAGARTQDSGEST